MTMDYIQHAIRTEQQRYAWDVWRARYPLMALGRVPFQSFTDYLAAVEGASERRINEPDPAEIEAEMLKVVAAYEANASRSRSY